MRYLLSLILFTILPFTIFSQSNTTVKINQEGEIIEGSLDSLIQKLQQGKALRIGWQLDINKDGENDLEHWINADFISILGGQVFNQIETIYRQSPKLDIPQVQISSSDVKWTGVIGTNGKLISRYIIPNIELVEDEKLKKILQKRIEIREQKVFSTWVIVD